MAEFDNGVIHRFECAKCEMEGVGSSFDSLDELQNHFVLCTSETMKRCPFCSHFIDKDNLVDHIERRHPENDFDYEDQEHSMVFPSKHRKPVIKSGGYETESVSVITSLKRSKQNSPDNQVYDLTHDDSPEEIVRDNMRSSVFVETSPPISNVSDLHRKDPYKEMFPGGFNTQESEAYYGSKERGDTPSKKPSRIVGAIRDLKKSSVFESENEQRGEYEGVKAPNEQYQSTSKEADEIKQRMGSRGDKMKENAGTDQDKADLNRIKKEGIEFTDQILSGQLLKNNIMCNGQKIPMMTAILKCIIETKKVDVTRKLKGLKVNKWNKERICKPGVSWIQTRMYSGHKRFHCMAYLGTNLANGICLNMSGACEGRSHDAACAVTTDLYGTLEALATFNGLPGCFSTDSAFPSNWPLVPAYNPPVTPSQEEFNEKMSSFRISAEWLMNEQTSRWSSLDFKRRQKLLLSDVGVWYINSVFLSNLSNCARPNIISQYFACLPPSLEHYLNVPANSLN